MNDLEERIQELIQDVDDLKLKMIVIHKQLAQIAKIIRTNPLVKSEIKDKTEAVEFLIDLENHSQYY